MSEVGARYSSISFLSASYKGEDTMATHPIPHSSTLGSDGSYGSSGKPSRRLSVDRLPDSILRCIGEYLPIPSRAMMAAALSRSACFDSDTLDFCCVEGSLTSQLTDSDMASILVAVDAVNRLKVLKLFSCTNITGIGLDPLRGSTVLEHLDLNTSNIAPVADSDALFSPNFPWRFTLTEDAVIPILDSIIAAKDGGALKLLELPSVWKKNKKTQLTAFLERYSSALSSRTCHCVQCNDDFSACSWMNKSKYNPHWGMQNYTCHDCKQNLCEECEGGFCRDCMQQFCESCREAFWCELCLDLVCNNCDDFEVCEDCDEIFCQSCAAVAFCDCCERARCMDCGGHNFCANSNCSKSNCDECAQEHNVQWCEVCEETYCNDCRLEDYKKGDLDCMGCRGLLLPRILHENEALNVMLKFVVHFLSPESLKQVEQLGSEH